MQVAPQRIAASDQDSLAIQEEGSSNANVTKRARRDLSPPPKNGPYVPVAPLQLESPGVARRNADLEAVQGRHPLASA